MPRPNWFFAFPLDGAFVEQLPAVPTSIRRYHTGDVHLTLAFLGGCGEESAQRALGVLEQQIALGQVRAVDVSLAEVVPMGPKRRYSALSALLGDGRAELTATLDSLGGSLCEVANGRRPSRAAKPHVTLARPRPRATDAAREAGLAWAAGLDLSGVRARLDRIALFTWSADRRDRLFQVVEERRLEG
jgi:2'-5' RNA ligase